MTTITLNLLVAEQLHEQAKARDPVKIGIAIGTGLLAVTVIVGVIVGQVAAARARQVTALQAKWDSLEALQAGPHATDTKAVQALANDYLAIHQGRQLFGPQLALIKDVIPDVIQLNQIRFAIQTTTVTPAPSADAGGDLTAAKAARAARPKTTERLTLILEGAAVSARPEIEVDEFIKSLQVHPGFSAFVSEVRLRSIARSANNNNADNANGDLPSALFVVECVYKEKQ